MDMSINSIHYFGRPVAIAAAATALAAADDDDDSDNKKTKFSTSKNVTRIYLFLKKIISIVTRTRVIKLCLARTYFFVVKLAKNKIYLTNYIRIERATIRCKCECVRAIVASSLDTGLMGPCDPGVQSVFSIQNSQQDFFSLIYELVLALHTKLIICFNFHYFINCVLFCIHSRFLFIQDLFDLFSLFIGCLQLSQNCTALVIFSTKSIHSLFANAIQKYNKN